MQRSFGLPAASGDFQSVIHHIDKYETLSQQERKALKQCLKLANVQRLNPDGLKRPRGLKADKPAQGKEDLDFPLERLGDLLATAATVRDRCLWLLLAASGLRTSEALVLKWEHVDLREQRVFVEDPNRLRQSKDMPLQEVLRFKGRSIARTHLFQPLRDEFFNALAEYLRKGYVA